MEKEDLLKCRDNLEKIRQKMKWDIKKVHKILQKEYKDITEYNSFFKQYKHDGKAYKGSVKNFCKYYKYIYNLEEVQETLTNDKPSDYFIGAIIGILLGIIIWKILFPNNEFEKISKNKECIKKCIQDNNLINTNTK